MYRQRPQLATASQTTSKAAQVGVVMITTMITSHANASVVQPNEVALNPPFAVATPTIATNGRSSARLDADHVRLGGRFPARLTNRAGSHSPASS